MLPTIELALSARLANPPEINTDRNGGLVVVLHLLSDTLGKRDGKAEPAWLRATLFGALAEKAGLSQRRSDFRPRCADARPVARSNRCGEIRAVDDRFRSCAVVVNNAAAAS